MQTLDGLRTHFLEVPSADTGAAVLSAEAKTTKMSIEQAMKEPQAHHATWELGKEPLRSENRADCQAQLLEAQRATALPNITMILDSLFGAKNNKLQQRSIGVHCPSAQIQEALREYGKTAVLAGMPSPNPPAKKHDVIVVDVLDFPARGERTWEWIRSILTRYDVHLSREGLLIFLQPDLTKHSILEDMEAEHDPQAMSHVEAHLATFTTPVITLRPQLKIPLKGAVEDVATLIQAHSTAAMSRPELVERLKGQMGVGKKSTGTPLYIYAGKKGTAVKTEVSSVWRQDTNEFVPKTRSITFDRPADDDSDDTPAAGDDEDRPRRSLANEEEDDRPRKGGLSAAVDDEDFSGLSELMTRRKKGNRGAGGNGNTHDTVENEDGDQKNGQPKPGFNRVRYDELEAWMDIKCAPKTPGSRRSFSPDDRKKILEFFALNDLRCARDKMVKVRKYGLDLGQMRVWTDRLKDTPDDDTDDDDDTGSNPPKKEIVKHEVDLAKLRREYADKLHEQLFDAFLDPKTVVTDEIRKQAVLMMKVLGQDSTKREVYGMMEKMLGRHGFVQWKVKYGSLPETELDPNWPTDKPKPEASAKDNKPKNDKPTKVSQSAAAPSAGPINVKSHAWLPVIIEQLDTWKGMGSTSSLIIKKTAVLAAKLIGPNGKAQVGERLGITPDRMDEIFDDFKDIANDKLLPDICRAKLMK